MRRIFVIAALTMAVSAPMFAQTATQQAGNAEQEVRKLHNEFVDALKRGDAATLERILADDYTFSGAHGVLTKPQRLEVIRSFPANRVESLTTEEVKVRMYGDTAVVTGRAAQKLAAEATPRAAQFTQVFAHLQGRWQVVASHVSELAAQAGAQATPQPSPQQGTQPQTNP